jgi:hypothetical protein
VVGRVASRPKGFPVLGGDPPADAEVAGVAHHRLGAQRSMLLEVLLDPAGAVVAADLRINPFGDDLSAVPATPNGGTSDEGATFDGIQGESSRIKIRSPR